MRFTITLSRAFFDINPSGVKGDSYIGIGTSCCDNSWDPVWEASTHIDEDGWTAEIRIPYSQLRFSRDSVQTWGLEVRRFIKRNNEQDQWAFLAQERGGRPGAFRPSRGAPYSARGSGPRAVAVRRQQVHDRGPRRGRSCSIHAAVRRCAPVSISKDRLTSNLAHARCHVQSRLRPGRSRSSRRQPDRVRNFFFPEKRPFFIEGSQVFDFGGLGCNICSNVEGMSAFYSRRIGRAPTWAHRCSRPTRRIPTPTYRTRPPFSPRARSLGARRRASPSDC